MMFGVGLHFSLEDLWAVRRIAIPGAVVQILVATALGAATATFWGWNLGAALVFGLALSVASTVVLLRALEARGVLNSVNGRIAVGWLVVEDLVVVLILVLLPALAGFGGIRSDPGGWSRWDPRQGRHLRSAHAPRRPAAVSSLALAGSPHRLTRALHPGRHLGRGGSGLRLGQVVRRILCARGILRGNDDARVGPQSPGRRGVVAAARRLFGVVLRVGRHAVRSSGVDRGAAEAGRPSPPSSLSARHLPPLPWFSRSAIRSTPR